MKPVEQHDIHDERLLTRAEVERYFGFPSKRYLEVASVARCGPPELRFGRLVRYRAADIRDWIDWHRGEGTHQ